MGQSNQKPLEALYKVHTDKIGSGPGTLILDVYNKQHLAAKEKLIREIARIVKNLGYKRVDPDASLDVLAKQIISSLPSSGSERNVKGSLSQLSIACDNIARMINKFMGYPPKKGVINVNQSKEKVCADVMDLIHGLALGINSEFLTVKAEANKVLKNLNILQNILEKSFTRFSSAFKNVGNIETHAAIELHQTALDELKKQKSLLNLIIGSAITPKEQSLITVLKKTNSMHNLISNLKNRGNRNDVAYGLSLALSGFNYLTHMANLSNQALKVVGMHMDDFKNLVKHNKLSERLFAKLKNKLTDQNSLEGLTNYMRAINYLKTAAYNDKILKEMDRIAKTGGKESKRRGGAINVSKHIKKRKMLIKQLLSAFHQTMVQLSNNALIAARHFKDEIKAGNMPITRDLREFANMLSILPPLYHYNHYLALSGLFMGIGVKYFREVYQSRMRVLISIMERILRKHKSIHLKKISDEFIKMLDTIKVYEKHFQKGLGSFRPEYKKTIDVISLGAFEKKRIKELGGDKFASRAKKSLKRGFRRIADKAKEVAGKVTNVIAESAIDLAEEGVNQLSKYGRGKKNGGLDMDVFKNTLSVSEVEEVGFRLNELVNTILYAVKISQFLDSLSYASKHINALTEGYDKILGKAVAYDRDNITRRINKIKKLEVKGRANNINGLRENQYRIILHTGTTNPNGTYMGQNSDPVASGFATHEFFKELGENPDRGDLAEIISSGDQNLLDSFVSRYQNSLKEWFLGFEVKRLKTIDDFLQAAESVDLCVKNFNDSLMKNPKQIKSIAKELESVEIITKTFNESAISDLCRFFESFYVAHDATKSFDQLPEIGPNAVGKSYDENQSRAHYQARVMASSLQNETAFDNQFRNLNPSLPEEVITSQTKGVKTIRKDISGNDVTISREYGNRILTKSARDIENIVDKIKSHFRGNMTLKNICSIFSKIGKNISNDFVGKSVGEIYKIIIDFLAYNSLEQYQAENSRGIFLAPQYDIRKINKSNCPFAIKAFKLLPLMIKSMCAKVLTAIGICRMLNSSMDKYAMGFYSPMRLAIGAAETTPTVIEGAIEMYVRLPLLAEAYREILSDDGTLSNWISFIPDIDGVFGELVGIVFNRYDDQNSIAYSSVEKNRIIDAVNKIYYQYKEKNDPCRAAVRDFINEINHRIGIISRAEWNKYLKTKKEFRNQISEFDYSDKGGDIIDLKLFDTRKTYRSGPSSQYISEGTLTSSNAIDSKNLVNIDMHKAIIGKLRSRVEKFLSSVWRGGERDNYLAHNSDALDKIDSITLIELIESRKYEIRNSANDKEKLRVAHKLISEQKDFAGGMLAKSLLLFHELVIAPLDGLAMIKSRLRKLKEKFLHEHDNIYLTYGGYEPSIDKINEKIRLTDRVTISHDNKNRVLPKNVESMYNFVTNVNISIDKHLQENDMKYITQNITPNYFLVKKTSTKNDNLLPKLNLFSAAACYDLVDKQSLKNFAVNEYTIKRKRLKLSNNTLSGADNAVLILNALCTAFKLAYDGADEINSYGTKLYDSYFIGSTFSTNEENNYITPFYNNVNDRNLFKEQPYKDHDIVKKYNEIFLKLIGELNSKINDLSKTEHKKYNKSVINNLYNEYKKINAVKHIQNAYDIVVDKREIEKVISKLKELINKYKTVDYLYENERDIRIISKCKLVVEKILNIIGNIVLMLKKIIGKYKKKITLPIFATYIKQKIFNKDNKQYEPHVISVHKNITLNYILLNPDMNFDMIPEILLDLTLIYPIGSDNKYYVEYLNLVNTKEDYIKKNSNNQFNLSDDKVLKESYDFLTNHVIENIKFNADDPTSVEFDYKNNIEDTLFDILYKSYVLNEMIIILLKDNNDAVYPIITPQILNMYNNITIDTELEKFKNIIIKLFDDLFEYSTNKINKTLELTKNIIMSKKPRIQFQIPENIQNKFDTFTNEVNQLQEPASQSEIQSEEVKNLKDELSRYKSIYDQQQKVIDSINNQIQSKNKQMRQLQQQMQQQAQQAQEARKTQQTQQAKQTQQQLAQKEQEIKKKLDELAKKLQEAQKVASKEKTKLQETQQKLQEKQGSQLASLQQEVNKLNNEMKRKNVTINKLNVKLDDFSQKLQKYEKEIPGINNTLNNIKNDVDKNTKYINNINKNLKNARSELSKLKGALDDMMTKDEFDKIKENLEKIVENEIKDIIDIIDELHKNNKVNNELLSKTILEVAENFEKLVNEFNNFKNKIQRGGMVVDKRFAEIAKTYNETLKPLILGMNNNINYLLESDTKTSKDIEELRRMYKNTKIFSSDMKEGIEEDITNQIPDDELENLQLGSDFDKGTKKKKGIFVEGVDFESPINYSGYPTDDDPTDDDPKSGNTVNLFGNQEGNNILVNSPSLHDMTSAPSKEEKLEIIEKINDELKKPQSYTELSRNAMAAVMNTIGISGDYDPKKMPYEPKIPKFLFNIPKPIIDIISQKSKTPQPIGPQPLAPQPPTLQLPASQSQTPQSPASQSQTPQSPASQPQTPQSPASRQSTPRQSTPRVRRKFVKTDVKRSKTGRKITVKRRTNINTLIKVKRRIKRMTANDVKNTTNSTALRKGEIKSLVEKNVKLYEQYYTDEDEFVNNINFDKIESYIASPLFLNKHLNYVVKSTIINIPHRKLTENEMFMNICIKYFTSKIVLLTMYHVLRLVDNMTQIGGLGPSANKIIKESIFGKGKKLNILLELFYCFFYKIKFVKRSAIENIKSIYIRIGRRINTYNTIVGSTLKYNNVKKTINDFKKRFGVNNINDLKQNDVAYHITDIMHNDIFSSEVIDSLRNDLQRNIVSLSKYHNFYNYLFMNMSIYDNLIIKYSSFKESKIPALLDNLYANAVKIYEYYKSVKSDNTEKTYATYILLLSYYVITNFYNSYENKYTDISDYNLLKQIEKEDYDVLRLNLNEQLNIGNNLRQLYGILLISTFTIIENLKETFSTIKESKHAGATDTNDNYGDTDIQQNKYNAFVESLDTNFAIKNLILALFKKLRNSTPKEIKNLASKLTYYYGGGSILKETNNIPCPLPELQPINQMPFIIHSHKNNSYARIADNIKTLLDFVGPFESRNIINSFVPGIDNKKLSDLMAKRLPDYEVVNYSAIPRNLMGNSKFSVADAQELNNIIKAIEDSMNQESIVEYTVPVLESLLEFSEDCENMIEVNYDSNGFSFDYSGLINSCDKQISNIKHAIEKFRGLLPANIIKKYEKTEPNKSLYELENYFINYLRPNYHNSDSLAKDLAEIKRSIEHTLNKSITVNGNNHSIRLIAVNTKRLEKKIIKLISAMLSKFKEGMYGNEKIYIKVLDKIVNGVLNDQISNKLSFQILPNYFVSQIKNLYYATTTFKRKYVEQDFNALSSSVKYKMSVYAPYFKKYAMELIKHAELLKKVLLTNPRSFEREIKETKLINFISLLGDVVVTCDNLIAEVESVPVFYNLRENFVTNFQKRTGKIPFMPGSLMLNFERADQFESFVNADERMIAGLKPVMMCKQCTPSIYPSMFMLLKHHNESSSSNHRISSKLMCGIIEEMAKQARYMGCSNLFRSARSTFNYTDAMSGTLKYSINAMHNIVESSDVSEAIGRIIDNIGDTNQEIRASRNQLRAFNIIDLNESLININALAREIPFINLYNGSYTFESAVADLLSIRFNIVDKAIGAGNEDIERPKEILFKFLCNPFKQMNDNEFALFESLIRGTISNNSLGRPKLIEDIFNTIMLTSYASNEFEGINSMTGPAYPSIGGWQKPFVKKILKQYFVNNGSFGFTIYDPNQAYNPSKDNVKLGHRETNFSKAKRAVEAYNASNPKTVNSMEAIYGDAQNNESLPHYVKRNNIFYAVDNQSNIQDITMQNICSNNNINFNKVALVVTTISESDLDKLLNKLIKNGYSQKLPFLVKGQYKITLPKQFLLFAAAVCMETNRISSEILELATINLRSYLYNNLQEISDMINTNLTGNNMGQYNLNTCQLLINHYNANSLNIHLINLANQGYDLGILAGVSNEFNIPPTINSQPARRNYAVKHNHKTYIVYTNINGVIINHIPYRRRSYVFNSIVHIGYAFRMLRLALQKEVERSTNLIGKSISIINPYITENYGNESSDHTNRYDIRH